jgi:hypothetical protein
MPSSPPAGGDEGEGDRERLGIAQFFTLPPALSHQGEGVFLIFYEIIKLGGGGQK